MITRELKDFVLKNSELYFEDSSRVLLRVISKSEIKEELKPVHDLCCEDNDTSLYRHLQRR